MEMELHELNVCLGLHLYTYFVHRSTDSSTNVRISCLLYVPKYYALVEVCCTSNTHFGSLLYGDVCLVPQGGSRIYGKGFHIYFYYIFLKIYVVVKPVELK